MSDILLYLGNAGFTFEDLPEKLPFGGDQTTAVRKFPGGGIQVQTLGAFDVKMSWDGLFYGPGAWTRAQAIGVQRIAGKEVLLRFGTMTRYVIIETFTVNYCNDEYVEYSITLQNTRKSGEVAGVGSPAVSLSNPQPQGKMATLPSGDTMPTTNQKTYTIQPGDTFWKLAVQEYGDGTQWTKIATANPGVDYLHLQAGQTIVIP